MYVRFEMCESNEMCFGKKGLATFLMNILAPDHEHINIHTAQTMNISVPDHEHLSPRP